VDGSDDRRVGFAGGKRVDVDAALVDRDWDGVQLLWLNRPRRHRVARVLDRDARPPRERTSRQKRRSPCWQPEVAAICPADQGRSERGLLRTRATEDADMRRATATEGGVGR
jgi:hypothetical protein